MPQKRILSWILSSQHRIVAVAILLLLAVLYVDWITGPHVSMSVFYLILALAFTWYLGRFAGCVVALSYGISSVLLQSEEPGMAHIGRMIWNASMHFIGIVVVVWIVNFSKNLSREVERLFAAKSEALSRELQFRKESEEAIHRLASQLSAAEDAARRKLGQDVHDAIGQNLTVLRLQLEELGHEFPPESTGRRHASGALELLETVVQQSRTLTFELYPSMLDDLGLGPTLVRYAEQLQSHTTTHVTVSESGATPDLPPAVRAFLFRAVKELVNNSIKHGRARDVIINIRAMDGNVRIFVDDDGSGFDPSAKPPHQIKMGLGLAWITERIHSFGGNLRVESENGHGVRVLLDLPLPNGAK